MEPNQGLQQNSFKDPLFSKCQKLVLFGCLFVFCFVSLVSIFFLFILFCLSLRFLYCFNVLVVVLIGVCLGCQCFCSVCFICFCFAFVVLVVPLVNFPCNFSVFGVMLVPGCFFNSVLFLLFIVLLAAF